MSYKFSLLSAIASEETIRSFAYTFINGTYKKEMSNMVQGFIYMNQLLSDPFECEKFNAPELLESIEGYLYTILSSDISFNLRRAVIKFMGSLATEINKKQSYTIKNCHLIKLLLENGLLYGYGKFPRDPDYIFHPLDKTESIFRLNVKYAFDNLAKNHTYDELPRDLENFNSLIHIFYDLMVSIMNKIGDDHLKHYRYTIEFDKLNKIENNVLDMLLPALMVYSNLENFQSDLIESDYIIIMTKITTKLLFFIEKDFSSKMPKKGIYDGITTNNLRKVYKFVCNITILVKNYEKNMDFYIIHQNWLTFINSMCIDTAVNKKENIKE
uniref:Ufd2P_core domain-containing protein n=1 Tax=Strongyloides stercoralis TaxID=6248 RepID=A0A0K0ETN0_STRER